MRNVLLLLATASLALTACGSGSAPVPSPSTDQGQNPASGPGQGQNQGTWGDPSTVTQAQLNACPLANTSALGAIPAGVNECTKGTLNGFEGLASKVKCSLTLNGNGTFTYNSPALSNSITVRPLTNVYYTHTVSIGQHSMSYKMADDKYPASGDVNISFMYSGNVTAETSPNMYIFAKKDLVTDLCVTHIN